MKSFFQTAATVFVAATTLAVAVAGPTAGDPAPAFAVADTKGKTHQLSDYADKVVVLEWTNAGCPFVRKHYDSGSLPRLQKTFTGKDVIWLTVATGEIAKSRTVNDTGHPTAILLDEDASLAKAYGAKTTAQAFIIANGKIVYNGAFDDIRSTDPDDILKANHLLAQALHEVLAGTPVTTPTSTPYGCAIVY
jgi:peroxiredoxin